MNDCTIFIYFLFLQIILGAFVSGLDAGKIYQTWPLMNDNYFPSDTNILSYKDIVNFDNQSLVQFYHRNLAYIIFVLFFISTKISLSKGFCSLILTSASLLFI